MTSAEEATLEAQLVAAATDAASIPEFIEALLESTVLVAGVVDPTHDDGRQSATLVPLVNAAGDSIQPFFTSEERLNETRAAIPTYESRWIALPCRVLWEMTRGATLFLNPNSDYGKEFLPGEIARLLDGAATVTETVVKERTEVLVGVPAMIPPGMEDALLDVFGKHQEVASGYLGWKVTPSTNDEAYLVVVVGPSDVRLAVRDDLSRALLFFSQSHPIDVMYAEPGASHLLSDLEPIYVRGAQVKKRRWPFGRK